MKLTYMGCLFWLKSDNYQEPALVKGCVLGFHSEQLHLQRESVSHMQIATLSFVDYS